MQEIPPPPRDDARLSNTTGTLQKPLLYHFDVFSAVHIMLLPSQKLPFRIRFLNLFLSPVSYAIP